MSYKRDMLGMYLIGNQVTRKAFTRGKGAALIATFNKTYAM